MAKDKGGHGSEAHGGSGQTPVQAENAPFKSRLPGSHFLDPNDPRVNDPLTRMKDIMQGAGAHSQGVQQIGKPVDMQRRQYEAIAGAIMKRLPGPSPTCRPECAAR